MRRFLVSTVMLALLPAAAGAQMREPEFAGFVTVYGGLQSRSGTSTTTGSLSVYDETGSWTAEHQNDSSAIVSIGAGAKLWGNFGVGVAYSRASDSQLVATSASVPHPLVFNAPRTATADLEGLKQVEGAVHVSALFLVPLSDFVDVSFGAGPTFFSVKKDFVQKAGFTEGASPFTSVTLTPGDRWNGSESAIGFHVSAEAAVHVTDTIGLGAFARYAKGTATFAVPDQSADIDVDAGGIQAGVGFRIRF